MYDAEKNNVWCGFVSEMQEIFSKVLVGEGRKIWHSYLISFLSVEYVDTVATELGVPIAH